MTLPRFTVSPLRQLLALLPKQEDWPRLQHALEQWPAAAFVVAPRANAFVTCNARAVALTGWRREELNARSLPEVIETPEALDAFYSLEPGHIRNLLNVHWRTHSGRAAYTDLRLSALDDPEHSGALVLALATPIEERLAQERQTAQTAHILNRIEHLLALLAAPNAATLDAAIHVTRDMFMADAAGFFQVTPDQPGLVLRCADNVPDNFPRGLGPSELPYLEGPLRWAHGQRTESYIHQAAHAAGWAHWLSHPVGDPPALVGALFLGYRHGNPPSPRTAAMLPLAARQIHQLLIQIARNAELASAQKLAVRLTHQLAAFNAQIDEGMLIINAGGRIDEINAAAAQLLGYRAEDVIGLPYDAVLISDGALMEATRQKLNGEGPGKLEDTVRRRNGEGVPVLARLRALPAPDNGCMVTLHNLSDTRAHAAQREHLDQLAYMGQATQSFAHEVRGPLNNIAMGVQYLAARLPVDEANQQAIAKIQTECNRLSSLMNDMLAWAKPVDPHLEPTDLTNLVRRLLNRWGNKLQQRNVKSVFHADEAVPLVLADPRLLEQIFVNLIDNGLQAMPAGGQLSVRVRAVHRESQGGMVEASVADTGPGIPEETRRRIFDPYFTTKPDGTGLGLAICKRLVTIHRGAIALESFPDSGTVFTVTLPALESTDRTDSETD